MGAPVGRRQPRVATDVAVRAWHILRSRLRSLVFRGGRESDLDEELHLHLERETERLQASGLSRADARLQALRLFGGVEQIKEASRDARGTAAFDALARDTRYAVRRRIPLILEYEDDVFRSVAGERETGLMAQYHHRAYRWVLANVSACIAVSPRSRN